MNLKQLMQYQSDAEFIFDLGKVIRKSELGCVQAKCAFEQISSSAESQQLTSKFLEDCTLAKEFFQPKNIAIQLRALVEDWSRLRIQGELSRKKLNQ